MKCPYCAGDIKDEAVKCKHCGEWLNKNISDDSMTKENNIALSSGADNNSDSNKVKEQPPTDMIYSPKARVPKWGWGWLPLMMIMVPTFQSVEYLNGGSTYFIYGISPFILLAFYFWYRNRLIKKYQFIKKAWLLPFMSGFVSYLLALTLIFVIGFISASDYNNELKENYLYFQKKTLQAKQEDKKYFDAFIYSPETESDINNNIEILENYYSLIDKRKLCLDELMTLTNAYISKNNYIHLKDKVNLLNEESLKSIKLAEESTTALIKYYKTGDDKWFHKYEQLSLQMKTSEEKANELQKVIMANE